MEAVQAGFGGATGGGGYVSGSVGIGTTNPTSKLQVQGDVSIASTVGIGTVIDIVPYDTLNSGTLSFEGSAGQLFSITNNLTSGSIFSVNDVSGIPSIDVDANGTVSLVAYGGNVAIGSTGLTGTASQKLQVTGGGYVSGSLGIGTTNPSQSLHVQGNVRVTGALYDGTNLTGSSGQILSSTGSAISWINASSANVGSANSIAIAVDSTNASRYLTFVSTTSGNNLVYVNSSLLFNPSTGDASVNGLTIGKGTGSVSSNTALGYQALLSNTTGIQNTATGAVALFSNTTGSNNTANGYYALAGNTTGSNNTATGWKALTANTIGIQNTANGVNALAANTTGTQNTANGYRALLSNTTGNFNSAYGHQALTNNTTGTNNTATGTGALQSNTTGIQNTANGVQALLSNTTGIYNTANGYRALVSNTTGGNNTATGTAALYSNTTGIQNTATGVRSLESNTTGNYNTATGHSALYSNTTGIQNTATGYAALLFNTTGINNTATGLQALYYSTTGTQNTANGLSALQSNTTGSSNTATGLEALTSNTTGQQNTATGYFALRFNTTGIRNTAIGLSAGSSITTGSNNTFLGYDAQPSSATVSNEITLGDTDVTTLRVPGLGFYGVRTNTTVATTSITTIDSIVVATYRSARIQIQITQGSNYQVSDVLLIHDGTTASIIEYGTLATGSTLGTYSATINSGNALLQVTMGSATSSAVKVLSYRTVV